MDGIHRAQALLLDPKRKRLYCIRDLQALMG